MALAEPEANPSASQKSEGVEETVLTSTPNPLHSRKTKMSFSVGAAGDTSSIHIHYESRDDQPEQSDSISNSEQSDTFANAFIGSPNDSVPGAVDGAVSGDRDVFSDSGILRNTSFGSNPNRSSRSRSVTFAAEPEIIERTTDDDSRNSSVDSKTGSPPFFTFQKMVDKGKSFCRPKNLAEGEAVGQSDGGGGCCIFKDFCSEDGLRLIFSYFLSIVVLFWDKWRWMVREFNGQDESHLVGKMSTFLLLLFSYSMINCYLEGLRLTNALLAHYNCTERSWTNRLLKNKLFQKFLSLGTTRVAVPPAATMVACRYWDIIWKNYTCKSYHDGSCKKTWIGKWVSAYRDEACYDGMASHAICERFVSYVPLIVATLTMVLLGNLIVPLMVDRLVVIMNRWDSPKTKKYVSPPAKVMEERKTPSPIPHSEVLNASIYEVTDDEEDASTDPVKASPESELDSQNNGVGVLVGGVDNEDSAETL